MHDSEIGKHKSLTVQVGIKQNVTVIILLGCNYNVIIPMEVPFRVFKLCIDKSFEFAGLKI